jgi:GNAT superfamily N-acetyltransferase
MIREATTADIPRLLEMGRKFAEEAGVAERVGWSDEAAQELLEQLVEAETGILLCNETGMIGGLVFAHPFSGAMVFQELFWRSHGRDGIRLLRAAEDRARSLGAQRSIMIGMDTMPDTERLYGRLGYTPGERAYHKEL